MSSFIVRPETINRIVTFLGLASGSGRIENSGIQHVLKQHGIQAEAYRDKEALVKSLLALNIQAVHERYGDTSLDTMPGKNGMKTSDYTFKIEPGSRVRVLKSLSCLTYQCAEGHVPETPLYKFLEDLENAIAMSIVHAMPEYINGGWD